MTNFLERFRGNGKIFDWPWPISALIRFVAVLVEGTDGTQASPNNSHEIK